MRPSKLSICAWGPYPELVEIDFDQLQQKSIFLIAGPTGAGKTTIFDAIVYALYGNMSGNNREKNSVRSDFASPDMETYVEFIFTHKGKTYSVRRSPKYERPKKRSQGVTVSQETAELQVGTEPPIVSIQEVNRKIHEILGINYAQFKQIAMIAQGEFLNLLYAKSEEKVEIFRNIFKTQMYDQILKNLTDRSKKLAQTIKEHEHKMEEAIASIDCGTNEELREHVSVDGKNYDEIMRLLTEDKQTSEGIVKQCKEDIAKLEVEYADLLNLISAAKELNRNIDQLSFVREQRMQLRERESEITSVKLQLARARQAQEVEVYEQLANEAFKREQQWAEKVRLAEEELNRLKEAILQLEPQLEYVKILDAKVEEYKQTIQTLQSWLPLYESLDEQTKQYNRLQAKLETIQCRETELKQQQQLCQEECKKFEEIVKKYESVDADIGKVRLQIEQTKQNRESIEQIIHILGEVQDTQRKLEASQAEYLHQEQCVAEVKSRYEAKERMYRQAAVGLVARYLEDNQPCPVCGSMEHPNKAVISNDIPDEAELEREKNLYEAEQEKYAKIYKEASALSGAMTSKQEELARRKEQLGITDHSVLSELLHSSKEEEYNLITQCKKLEDAKKERERCQEKLLGCSQQLEAIIVELDKAIDERSKIQRDCDQTTGSIQHIRQQLPQTYTGIAQVHSELLELQNKVQADTKKKEDLLSKKEQMMTKKESTEVLLASHKNEYEDSRRKRASTVGEFHEHIENCGFANQEEYQAAKCTTQQVQAKELIIQQYIEQMTSYEEQEKQLVVRINGKERIDIDALQQTLQQVTDRKQEQLALSESMATHLSCNLRVLESLREKTEKVKKLSLDYGYIKDLENVAKGVNAERIVFEHYVLAAYFEEILAAANLRLSVMTNSRYELLKVSKVADQRTKNSLDLEVLDQYTGKRRSVKTLSGGESFKAALSLALGLSDIIQQNAGGIEIDTLFIDEGFGSLDSESLDQAMKTLTSLTGGNKLIGIISHVNELKERIDAQIIIEKDQKGSSLRVQC